MRPEIEYRLLVEQPVHGILNEVQSDVHRMFGVTTEEFQRAVWVWAMQNLRGGDLPEWMVTDLDRITPDTIEGEAG